MTRLLTAVVVLIAGCSSRAPAPTHPTPDRPPTGSGSSSTGTIEDTKVTEAECLAAIDHSIELDLKDRPADQQLTAEQIETVRTTVRKNQLAACLKQPREVVTCIVRAIDRAALGTCGR